jgi:uncharacterized protein with ParB-like and HNH nuclease domain
MRAASELELCYAGVIMSGMSSTFHADPAKVGYLLGPDEAAPIAVPEFQRGYEWTSKHVKAFWEDVDRCQHHEKEHFFGTIVVLKKPDAPAIELLDGQQRLATATILFAVLRDVAKEIGSKEAEAFADETQNQLILKENTGGCALRLSETDDKYFRDAIQKPTKTAKPKIRTHRNIYKASRILREAVEKLTLGAPASGKLMILKSIRRTLRGRFVMACIPVDTEDDAFNIF